MNSPVLVWRQHKLLHESLGKKGRVVVWTKIYVAPEGFEQEAPYVVAMIEFADKSRKSLQLVDIPEQHITHGMEVEVVVRRVGKASPDGVILYGLKARPITS